MRDLSRHTGVVADLLLPDEKPAARREIRARRRRRADDTPPDAREQQARALRDHLAPLLDQLAPGAIVTSYVSRPTEPPTHRLNDDLTRRGLDLVLPVVLDDLDLAWERPDSDEPPGIDVVASASLVVLPALAIATTGMRLGQGGGCYDRVLTRVDPRTPLVAVVHDDEVVARVPAEEHDRPVDAVVTAEAGLRTFPSWEQRVLRN